MKETFFKQCKLIKPTTTGMLVIISYIPEKHAVIGHTVKLKNDNVWTEGWVVHEVYGNRIAESLLPDSHDSIKQHRKNTGDSLPKVKHE